MLTGATQGIGEAVARGLCPLVDVLVLHGLEPETKVQRLLDELRRTSPRTDVVYLSADYGRLADVGALVAAARARVDDLEVLINNAGRPGPPSRTPCPRTRTRRSRS